MDYLTKLEFLNRYSKFKNRPGLIYALSAAQLILAIGILIWFFAPRWEGYVTAKPKGYLAQSFKPSIRYVLAKSDIVGGTASPSGYIKVILKEPKITLRAKANAKGNWLVKIPQKIPEKNYQMQIISFDSKGKNPKVKIVRLKIESNNAIVQSKAYRTVKSWYLLAQKQLSKLRLA